ncbi:MAG: hypothetical protein WD904_06435 [Dehalococcoidia bacterium]
MDWIQEHLALPKNLSSRLWLITLPSAVISFERRSDVPKLPKAGRVLGFVMAGAGAALGFMALRQPGATLAYEGPLAPVARTPATAAGLLGLVGAAFLTRSTFLLLYALGLAFAAGTERMTLEEPTSGTLLGRD